MRGGRRIRCFCSLFTAEQLTVDSVLSCIVVAVTLSHGRRGGGRGGVFRRAFEVSRSINPEGANIFFEPPPSPPLSLTPYCSNHSVSCSHTNPHCSPSLVSSRLFPSITPTDPPTSPSLSLSLFLCYTPPWPTKIRQRRCEVEYISFSAHVDFVQNKGFIDGVQVCAHQNTTGRS